MLKIDASELALFAECPRKYKYLVVDKVKVSEKPSLLFGVTMHDAIAVWLKVKQKEAAIAVWEDFLVDENNYNKEFGKHLTEMYIETYQNDVLLYQEIEQDFDFEYNGVVFFGTVDGIAKWQNTDEIWVVDHKTTMYGFRGKYFPSFQGYIYAWYCKQKYGKCNGFIADVISTARNPSRRFFRESYPFYNVKWEEIINCISNWTLAIKNCKEFLPNWNSCHRYGKCEFYSKCIEGGEE